MGKRAQNSPAMELRSDVVRRQRYVRKAWNPARHGTFGFQPACGAPPRTSDLFSQLRQMIGAGCVFNETALEIALITNEIYPIGNP